MKRLLAVVFLMMFLTGCGGQTKTPVSDMPDEQPLSAELAPEVYEKAVLEPNVPLAEEPEIPVEPEITAALEVEQSQPPKAEPETAREETLAEKAAAVYVEITKTLTFDVSVTEIDGTVTELAITPENAYNVTGQDRTFVWTYRWSDANEADWEAQLASPERGNLLMLSAEGNSFACCSGGDVIRLVSDSETFYLRAVNPRDGEPFEKKLYGALILIAEDAVSAQVWNVTADGTLLPAAAASALAEAIAENYRNVPAWVAWKPLDVQAGDAMIYDLYKGDPQQFCYGMNIRVKFADFECLNTAYWQAGAGLSEADAEGYYGWGAGICVTQDETGNWSFSDRGTGGVFVHPPVPWEEASVEQLVEIFCLTEGNTHTYLAPNYILQRSGEELARLPEILNQLTEAESADLCATLGSCLREYDYWAWSVDTLKGVLGSYGPLLDA